MTTHTPYGYKVENGKFVINNEEAIILKKLFEVYIECESMTAAAKRVGINKTHSVIGRLIKNKKYLGTEVYPQIIDEELFNKANELKHLIAVRTKRYKPKEIKPVEEIQIEYKLKRVDEKFKDPYKQAEYAFSCIKEVVSE